MVTLSYDLLHHIATYAECVDGLQSADRGLARRLKKLGRTRRKESIIRKTMSPCALDLFGPRLLARAHLIRWRPGLITRNAFRGTGGSALTARPDDLPAPVCLGVDPWGCAFIIIRFAKILPAKHKISFLF